MKNPKVLLRTSLTGTVIVALCCFTPVLVVVLNALGLATFIGYLDYVLLPALAFFSGMTVYAFWQKKKFEARCKRPSDKEASL